MKTRIRGHDAGVAVDPAARLSVRESCPCDGPRLCPARRAGSAEAAWPGKGWEEPGASGHCVVLRLVEDDTAAVRPGCAAQLSPDRELSQLAARGRTGEGWVNFNAGMLATRCGFGTNRGPGKRASSDPQRSDTQTEARPRQSHGLAGGGLVAGSKRMTVSPGLAKPNFSLARRSTVFGS